MKKLFFITLILGLFLASCDQDNIGSLYEPESPYIAFSSPVVSENILSTENNFSVRVQVVRSDLSTPTTGEVSLEMNDNINGVFALESNTVTFEDGKGEAYVKIVPVVDPSMIDPTKTYVFKLTITSDNASQFFNTTTYRASFKYTPIGTGYFKSSAFDGEWPVDIEKLEVGNTILYKAKSLYEQGYDVTITVEGENVTVNNQAAWYYDAQNDAFITGSGTINGKTLTMTIEHFVPGIVDYGGYTEVLTLP